MSTVNMSMSEIEMEVEVESAKLKEIQNQMSKSLDLESAMAVKDQKEIDTKSVYVGNVDWHSKSEDLESHFNGCGSIVRVTIPKDRFTQRQKNFAYIEFDTVEAVQKALLLNATVLRNRPIVVTAKRTNVPGMSASRGMANKSRGGRGGTRNQPVVVKYVYVNGPAPSRRGGMSRGGRGRFNPY